MYGPILVGSMLGTTSLSPKPSQNTNLQPDIARKVHFTIYSPPLQKKKKNSSKHFQYSKMCSKWGKKDVEKKCTNSRSWTLLGTLCLKRGFGSGPVDQVQKVCNSRMSGKWMSYIRTFVKFSSGFEIEGLNTRSVILSFFRTCFYIVLPQDV